MLIKSHTDINGVKWYAGAGPRTARVMIVTPCMTPEEASDRQQIGYDKFIKRTPRVLEYDLGITLKDLANSEGLDLNKCFCVPLVRYVPENVKHIKNPPSTIIKECLPCLEADVKNIKPSIMVCVGKKVFDAVMPGVRFQESEIYGAWFYRADWNCRIYSIPAIGNVTKPEKFERFKFDFSNIVRELNLMDSKGIEKVPCNDIIVKNHIDLIELVSKLSNENRTVLSVDCEWHGHVHVDGKLRSLQICWGPSDAAYIRFMDDQLNYVFDVDYKTAGTILGTWCNRPEVKYIGHHLSADLVWMHYWLGLDYYEKGIFDSEFALQACDEAADLGLDALALRYTDFGKYDIPLIAWKKENGKLCKDGYGYIPDDILIPYALKDVYSVMRAYPIIWKMMEDQNLVRYYNNILNPMVTDVFAFLTLKGIPVDRDKLDHMREFYNWSKEELTLELKTLICKEAENLLISKVFDEFSVDEEAREEILELFKDNSIESEEQAIELIKSYTGAAGWLEVLPVIEHWKIAPMFNIGSTQHLKRWLFDVKKYEPIKSTNMKQYGIPAMDWTKVMTLPPDQQIKYTPACDKGTLEVLASRYSDSVLDKLLELNAIRNICKAFLKPSDVDDDGNLVKENGMHYWLASDDALHTMSSTTETGRPRSWNPNILNLPSYIHGRLGAGIKYIVDLRASQKVESKDKNGNIVEKSRLPEFMQKYTEIKPKNYPTMRSIAMARPGWCMPEADLQTAEMRGLAFLSGDRKLLKMLLEPDECWAKVDPKYIPEDINPEDCVVRIAFPDYIHLPADKEKYLLTYASDKVIHAKFTEDQLLRDENGKIVSPKFDMHWGVVELSRGTVREELNKKKDRGAGKVVNFSSSYGGQAPSLARKIEADTGTKPEIEDVEAMLEAIKRRQPRATEWFEELEQVPKTTGKLVAKSGRIRHCHTFKDIGSSLSYRTKEGVITALGRECRNFFLQESVAAVAARALKNMVDMHIKFGLKGYPCVCLYDSIVVHCPWEERTIWGKALELYMYLANGWYYDERVLRYAIDLEYNAGWSTAPDKEYNEQLKDPNFHPTPPHLKYVEQWLDNMIKLYTDNPKLSVYNVEDL